MSFKDSGYKDKESYLESQRRHYRKNRDHYKEKQLRQRQERKEFLLENLGHSCSVCGSTEKLEFDHINPSYKNSRQSFLSMGLETIRSQLDNIQVLCQECHKKKSNAQKTAAWKLFVSLPLEEQERLISQVTDGL
jgi:5-methylcytosine-specific restriction endonuclease McrA